MVVVADIYPMMKHNRNCSPSKLHIPHGTRGVFNDRTVSSIVRQGVMRRRTGGSLRPSLNLLAAALAGAVNQAFTLPLENITTRMQTAGPIRRPDSSGRPSSSRPTFGANSEGHDIAREAEDNSSGNGKESSMRNLVSTVGRHENPIAEGAGATSHAVRAVATRGGSEGGVESSMFGGAGTGGTTDRDPNLTITATGGSKPRSPGTVVDNLDVHDEGSAGVAGNGVERGAGANPSLPDLHASCSPDSPRQRPPRRQRQSLLSVARDLYLEGNGMGRFWRGFTPSLILTCNPAINYTTFDVLKALWLKRRAKSRAVAAVGPLHVGDEFLDPIEAFVIAAIAKSIATLVTYPLIRAKVILMTSSCSKTKSDQAEEVEGEEALTNEMDHEETSSDPKDGLSRTGTWNMAGESERRRIPTLAEKEKYLSRDGGGLGEGGASRMAHVLLDIVRSEGVAGLYAGCGAQVSSLLNTEGIPSLFLLTSRSCVEGQLRGRRCHA